MASNRGGYRGGPQPRHRVQAGGFPPYNHRVTSETTETSNRKLLVYLGGEAPEYGFDDGHPFGLDRLGRFLAQMDERGLADLVEIAEPVMAAHDEIARFHTESYIAQVAAQSVDGIGFLDYGDTPAFPGIYEAAATVVGSVLEAAGRLVSGPARRAFVPTAGLHHARRDRAGGFCVFNDPGIAIETLRSHHGFTRIAYVDIDAHHGDGVFYAFESEPGIVIGDIHEDGRYLYPGTGAFHETGSGPAEGSKLNIPLPPGAGDDEFFKAWNRIEAHIDAASPEFVILQCGADGLAGDPLAHLEYTAAAYRHATSRLCRLADRHCSGRILALGGGGYRPQGIADAWCAVLEAMLA